jgi:methylase of polypeptide subunit release factors
MVREADGALSPEQKRRVAELYVGKGVLAATPERWREDTNVEAEAVLRASERDQFFTPPFVGAFLATLLQIPRGAFVYDPAVGSGRMFLELSGLESHVLVSGTEIDPEACEVARALLGKNALVVNDDLIHYREVSARFTYCLGNPPFVTWLKDEGRVYRATNDQGRVPAMFAFMENAILALEQGGLLAVVVPRGWRQTDVVPEPFAQWFDSQVQLLLQIAVSASLFVRAGSGDDEWLVFSMEVFQKSVGGAEDAAGIPPVKLDRLLPSREIETLARLPLTALYASCPELRLFGAAYGALLAGTAGKARRGVRPQPLLQAGGGL